MRTEAYAFETAVPILDELLGQHRTVVRSEVDMTDTMVDVGRKTEALEILWQLRQKNHLDRSTRSIIELGFFRAHVVLGNLMYVFCEVPCFISKLPAATLGRTGAVIRMKACIVMADCCAKMRRFGMGADNIRK